MKLLSRRDTDTAASIKASPEFESRDLRRIPSQSQGNEPTRSRFLYIPAKEFFSKMRMFIIAIE